MNVTYKILLSNFIRIELNANIFIIYQKFTFKCSYERDTLLRIIRTNIYGTQQGFGLREKLQFTSKICFCYIHALAMNQRLPVTLFFYFWSYERQSCTKISNEAIYLINQKPNREKTTFHTILQYKVTKLFRYIYDEKILIYGIQKYFSE